jgi:putative FmdB family regulatory protein
VPIFEFRCLDCGKKFSDLVGMTSDSLSPGPASPCPHCGSQRTSKLVSRFQRYRNEDDRVDAMADRLELMGEPDSPTAMRDMVREMGKAMDEDMSDEMEEMYEADMEGKLEDED